jgi:hypothetical protein
MFWTYDASLSGYLYYVLFIDDHSRKTQIYFLKTKDGVLARFQEFRALFENLTGRRIKVLRSDNGGEYTSKDLISVLKQGSRGSTPFHITLDKMGLQRGRTCPSLRQPKR